MANWYVNSVAYTAVAQWAATSVVPAGGIRRQLASPAVGSERCFRTSAGGTTGGAEPTWVLTKGAASPTDGTITDWVEVTGNETYQAPGAWAAPHARRGNVVGWAAAGDAIYISSNHAETQAAAMTITMPGTAASPNTITCVDESGTGHIPPLTGDFKTGASVTTTGAFAITLHGVYSEQGVAFSSGTGAVNPGLFIGSGSGDVQKYKNCAFAVPGTSTNVLACSSSNGLVEFDNCTFAVASVASFLQPIGRAIFKNSSALFTGATLPTIPFKTASGGGITIVERVDLSQFGSGKTLVGNIGQQMLYSFIDCKLNAAVTKALTPTSLSQGEIFFTRCNSGGAVYDHSKVNYLGSLTVDTSVVRSGGTSDGSTPLSWNITTTANASFLTPFAGLPIGQWNPNTGVNVNVTIEGIFNGASLPNNDQLWIEANYFGTASSTLGTSNSGTKANFLASGSALTATSSAWDSAATARANTTAYVLGNAIKLASNPGRVFFCTTAGTTAGSEPGGYASAVDGGSVTDGTAVFRAGVRFKQTLTLSAPQPQSAGDIYVNVRAALASSTFWIDPLITLS